MKMMSLSMFSDKLTAYAHAVEQGDTVTQRRIEAEIAEYGYELFVRDDGEAAIRNKQVQQKGGNVNLESGGGDAR